MIELLFTAYMALRQSTPIMALMANKTPSMQNMSNGGVFESTAYCLTGTTASGTQAGYGQVAVDPKVIPLGTELWIEGYGNAVATDTGGAIKGNIIDVYYPDCNEAINWGRRKVEVIIK